MSIGYRTIKTALGAAISIFIAQKLGLQYYASAGILTVLCIKVTRKESIRDSLTRFFACITGLALGSLILSLFGYSPTVLALFFMLIIPIMVRLKIQDGFITSAVIVMHIYTNQNISIPFYMNELQIIIIGIGMALLLNLSYMPNMEKKIIEYRQSIERNFSLILKEMAYYLRYGDSNWGGEEMVETVRLLNQAKNLAFINVENHFIQNKNELYVYFEMREKQFELLETMLPLVSLLQEDVIQREQIAVFLDKLSNSVHPGNTAHVFLEKLNELRNEFRKQPLPQSREEFEARAILFQLINEIEHYLFIKQDFKRNEQ
jgi:uncharacterized membrane protein YgaE (UPF0421/DUF939 family)